MASLSTGALISIVYGGIHVILMMILAVKIFWKASQKNDESLSFNKFVLALWRQRGIYAPLLVHIYDTATGMSGLRTCRNDVMFH